MVMLPYVCKTLSHFQEKIRNLICQCLFYIQFILQSHCPQKTEIVRIFKYISCQIRLRRRQHIVKVIDCMTFSIYITITNLHHHNISAPSIMRSFWK